jgi:hypothetical protein
MIYSTFKRFVVKIALSGLSLFLVLTMPGCSGNKAEYPGPVVTEDLYFFFKTMDWEQSISCENIDLPAWQLDSVTYLTLSSSNPAPASFYFSYPKDSSQIVKPANLKKYSIQEVGQHTGPFQLSLILRLTKSNRNQWLNSNAGQSAAFFNEIIAVTYDGHNTNEAFFKVKGRYQMQTASLIDSSLQKTVLGMYQLRIRTTRK